MIIKLDFEKVFDSIDWSCLVDSMDALGFDSIWCERIHSLLKSMKASVLINGSLSEEFSFF